MEHYTLRLTAQQLMAISQALSNAPYQLAAPVVAELQRQINEQEKAAAARPSVAEPLANPSVAAG